MEFAKSQLERHGWSQGKGLGRHESGITDAIKVKLKFDTAGVGHNAADEFTYHWWSSAFDQAANNIQVNESKDGVTVKMDGNLTLSTKKPLSKAMTSKEMLYGRFVKAATLTNGTMEEEPSSSSSESDSEDDDDFDNRIKQVTDEELFKLCGGRTAHKGARHGLTATAKLSRVEEQEAAFMAKWAPKSEEKLSTTKNKKQFETELSLEDNNSLDQSERKKKKKRKKKRSDDEEIINEPTSNSSGYSSDTNENKDLEDNVMEDISQEKSQKKKKKRKDKEREKEIDDAISSMESTDVQKKKKKQKYKDEEVEDVAELEKPKKTKKKKNKSKDREQDEPVEDLSHESTEKESKKKRKRVDNDDEVIDSSQSSVILENSEPSESKKKKKKKSKK